MTMKRCPRCFERTRIVRDFQEPVVSRKSDIVGWLPADSLCGSCGWVDYGKPKAEVRMLRPEEGPWPVHTLRKYRLLVDTYTGG